MRSPNRKEINMDGPTITLIIGIVGCVIGVSTFVSSLQNKAQNTGVLEQKIEQALQGIDEIKKQFPKEYANMIVSSYLVGNEDLTGKSWGVLMSNQSGKIIGIAPLYGFEKCFLNYDAMVNLVIHEVAKNYAAQADIAYEQADISAIPEHFRDTFRSRCEEMMRIRDSAPVEEA